MATSVPVCSKPPKGQKARSCCFTLNNYTEEEVKRLRLYSQACSYLVAGYEIAPETGTPHIQGYVEWENPRSLEQFKKDVSSRIHYEVRRGTAKQASDYCKYEDYPVNKKPNKFEEFGELSKQGSRTDWSSALEMVKQQQPIEDIIEAQPQLIPCINHLEKLKCRLLKPLHREVEVIVIWGDAGTGKSRFAYDNYPDIYSKPPSKWWDGYTGQKTILLDDFYGYLPYSELLNVLDRYPYHAEVKGGYVWAQWNTVIITSNKKPSKWYSIGLTPALARRIKIIHQVIKDGNDTVWKNDTLENGSD